MEFQQADMILILKSDMILELNKLSMDKLRRVKVLFFEANPYAFEPDMDIVLSKLSNLVEFNIKIYQGEMRMIGDRLNEKGEFMHEIVHEAHGLIPIYDLSSLIPCLPSLDVLRIKYNKEREAFYRTRAWEPSGSILPLVEYFNKAMGVPGLLCQALDDDIHEFIWDRKGRAKLGPKLGEEAEARTWNPDDDLEDTEPWDSDDTIENELTPDEKEQLKLRSEWEENLVKDKQKNLYKSIEIHDFAKGPRSPSKYKV